VVVDPTLTSITFVRACARRIPRRPCASHLAHARPTGSCGEIAVRLADARGASSPTRQRTRSSIRRRPDPRPTTARAGCAGPTSTKSILPTGRGTSSPMRASVGHTDHHRVWHEFDALGSPTHRRRYASSRPSKLSSSTASVWPAQQRQIAGPDVQLDRIDGADKRRRLRLRIFGLQHFGDGVDVSAPG
jgi:hypothetical protein